MPQFFLILTIFILFFQPDYVWPGLQKIQLLRNTAIIAFITYFLFGKNDERENKFFKVKENIFLILFAVIQIISASFVWLKYSLEFGNIWLKMLLIYYLIFMYSEDVVKVKKMTIAIIIGIVYLSYYSISDYYINGGFNGRARGFGWYELANDLVIIFVATIPLCFMHFEISKGIFMKSLSLFCIILFSYNILITGSRQGLIALVFVGVASLFLSSKMGKTIKIVFVSVLVFGVIAVGLKVVFERHDINSMSTEDESWQARITQWHAGKSMLKKNLFFGVGPGQFRDNAVEFGGERGLAPHNTIVQVFAETGFLGGILYVAFAFWPIVLGVKQVMRQRQKKYPKSQIATAYSYILVALSGFWLCAIVSNRIFSYILYVLMAMLLGLRTYANGDPTTSSPPEIAGEN